MKVRHLVVFVIMATGCSAGHLAADCEVVMTPGMTIVGTNPNGTVKITAGQGARRSYESERWRHSMVLTERSARWNGSFGLADPGMGSSMYGRVIAEEGRIHFTSVHDAMRWLYVGSEEMRPVYTNNGLVVGYSVARPRNGRGEPTRSIAIWQLYINGRRPSRLPGADDTAIRVSGGDVPDTSTERPVEVGYQMVFSDSEYVAHR